MLDKANLIEKTLLQSLHLQRFACWEISNEQKKKLGKLQKLRIKLQRVWEQVDV